MTVTVRKRVGDPVHCIANVQQIRSDGLWLFISTPGHWWQMLLREIVSLEREDC
jgi:hypothetical protein